MINKLTAITLFVLIFSRADAKHLLIETEDDNSEAEGLGDLPEVNGEPAGESK